MGVPPGSFGATVVAAITLLLGVYGLSRRDTADLLRDMFSLPISVGAVVGCQRIGAAALAHPHDEAQAEIPKTLDKSRKHGTFRAHLWCFLGTDGTMSGPQSVAYGYTPSWEASEITDWFSAIDGFIQCDGYAGYAREVEDEDGQTLVAVPSDRRLGCGMHIRSKCHDALLAKDGRAAIPLKLFADLYAIEADCKERGLDAHARGHERRRRSWPILDNFRVAILFRCGGLQLRP